LPVQGKSPRFDNLSGDLAMIRRVVLVAAAAVALILAPGTAMAQYDASGVVMSGSAPTPGVPFTVHASGAKADEKVTLTIRRHPASHDNPGARVLTKPANASGVADFAVTLPEDGSYTLVSTGATGAVLGTQTVTVVASGSVIVSDVGAAAAAAPAAPRAAPAAPRADPAAPRAVPAAPRAAPAAPRAVPKAPVAAPGGQLSFTGFDGLGPALGGGALVLLGAGAVLAARRRRSAQVPD
jgi:hypothetical protein